MWDYRFFLLVEGKKMKVQCYVVIQGRDSLEVIKAEVGLHICLKEMNMDRKNRNKSIAVWRNHIEGLLTELMIAEMKRKIPHNGE